MNYSNSDGHSDHKPVTLEDCFGFDPFAQDLSDLKLNPPGSGHNASLFTVACDACHRGATPEATIDHLCAQYEHDRSDYGTAPQRAVKRAWEANGDSSKLIDEKSPVPPFVPRKLDRFDRMTMTDLLDASPTKVDASPVKIVKTIFKAEDLVCIEGAENYTSKVFKVAGITTIADSRKYLNPSTFKSEKPTKGHSIPRSDDNVLGRCFMVLENDTEPTKKNGLSERGCIAIRERFSGFCLRLSKYVPLVMAVDTGGKSVHSWFYCGTWDDDVEKVFAIACQHGADPKMRVKSQKARMPNVAGHGGRRDQKLLYYDPEKVGGEWDMKGFMEEFGDIPTVVPANLPFNDAGNAERFKAQFGETSRFCPQFGKWLHWNGQIWESDDEGDTHLKGMSLSRLIVTAGNAETSDKRDRLIKEGIKLGNRSNLENMLALAQKLKGIATPQDRLNKDGWLLSVANGVVNLRDGTFRAARQSDLITKQSTVSYDPAATSPAWDAFLDQILGGDADLIRFVRMAVGYSLTTETKEQCLFFLHGTGSNGKSTFTETIATLFGTYGQRAPKSLFTKNTGGGTAPTNDIARLPGIRFAVGSEVAEGSWMDEEKIKDLTGTDTVSARFLHKEFFDFVPTNKLWIYGNHRPKIKGTDHGIWRRIRLIPFEVTIEEKDRNPNLLTVLEGELSGILNWAIGGCLDWQEHGLIVPDSVKKATAQYQSAEDVLGQFISDQLEQTTDLNDMIGAQSLYSRYSKWCDDSGMRAKTKRSLDTALAERGLKSERGRYVENGKGESGTFWRYVRLPQENEAESKFF